MYDARRPDVPLAHQIFHSSLFSPHCLILTPGTSSLKYWILKLCATGPVVKAFCHIIPNINCAIWFLDDGGLQRSY